MAQFVVEEDRQLFTDRICSASDECMTNVFHTRFRDGISNVLNMEIFHVRVSGYLRADSHMIGVREYADVMEHVGTLSPQGAKGKDGRRASRRARPADAEHSGPPRSAGSSPASSSADPMPGADGEVAAWIDIASDRWAIRGSTPCFGLFWGGGPRGRASHLLDWVDPGQREPLIVWAQAAFQELLALRSSAAEHGPARSPLPCAQHFEGPVHLWPPSLQHIRARIAYAAVIALALPEEHEHQGTRVRLTFSDIRVVQQSSARRGDFYSSL